MFCSNCGQNLAGVATQYCPNCGHAEEILKTMNPQPYGGNTPHKQPGNAPQPYPQAQHQPPPHGYHGYPPHGQPPHTYPPYGYPPYGYYAKPPAQGMAGAALGLGIASFIIPIPVFNLILGIVGIVLAMTARNRGNRSGLATAGLVISIIGTVVAVLFAVIWMVFLTAPVFFW